MKHPTITIHLWKSDSRDDSYTPVKIQDMPSIDNYDAKINAHNLARLLHETMPGNTLDEFYAAIEREILPMLNKQENIEILKSPFDLSNRARVAINKLAELKEN